MKVKTSIKAGKKGKGKGSVISKCGKEANRGQCVNCCMDAYGAGSGDLCSAGCGRFYVADEG